MNSACFGDPPTPGSVSTGKILVPSAIHMPSLGRLCPTPRIPDEACAMPISGRSARDEERHGLQDLIFHVDERVFFQRDAPVGLPFGIHFHGVAPLLSVGKAFILPEMHHTAERTD